jgi:YidC/Oxa1 family membrane protein insertase
MGARSGQSLKGVWMKESGRFFLAIALMVGVIAGSNLLFRPAPQTSAPVSEVVVDSGGQGRGAVGAPAAGTADLTAAPETAVAATEAVAPVETVTVTSPLYRYAFSTRGASVTGAELLRYASHTREGAVDLVPANVPGLVGQRLQVGDRTVDLASLPFRAETAGPVELRKGDAPKTLWFTHTDAAEGFTVRIGYTFTPDSYVIDVRGEVRDLAGNGARKLLVKLGPTLASHEANAQDDEHALAYVVNSQREGVHSVALRSVKGERAEEGPIHWFALKNKYFLAAVLGEKAGEAPMTGVVGRPAGEPNTADVTGALPVAADGSFAYRVYLGPQDHVQLAAVGDGLQDANPYGWKVLRPIVRPLGHLITWALVGMHSALNLSYGTVLILFGILIRVLLWPLNQRAMRAQMRNMALQPRVQEIQKKYKEDPQRLQQEMLRLYKEEGFNPLGGCLPMLLPWPVLVTLFFVFQNTIEFRGVSFLWLSDLSLADPFFILPALLVGSMLVSQLVTARSMPANPQMKAMTYIMPLVMGLLFLKLPAGLNLFYAAQIVASIPQQVMLTRERRKAQERQAQLR